MIFVAVKLGRRLQLVHLPIHPHPHEAGLARILEDAFVFALAVHHQRRQEQQPAVLGILQDAVHDLLDRLRADLAAAVGAVGHADAGIEQAQVVVDLGDGADRGSRIPARPTLIDGDRGAQALDLVHVRFLHQPQELAGVGRERFDITPLTFSVDGVERQAGFAGAGQPGDHHQFVAGDFHVDVLQVVFARAAHDEFVHIEPPY